MSRGPARPVMMSPPGPRVLVDGHTYDYFGGTGYLGLQGHPEVLAAAERAVATFGVHTATSRNRYASPPVLNVERLAAKFFGMEDAYYFVSGYVGNEVVVRALAGTFDAVFVDEFAHYSSFEAADTARVPVHRFPSRSPKGLADALAKHLPRDGQPLVLTDGVFASFGWIAPIDEYVTVLDKHPGAALIVDDAHGFGVLGENGRGTLEHFGLLDHANRETPVGHTRLFTVGTLSKALGGHGGILPGSSPFVERAIRGSHFFEGATAPACPVAAAAARGLQIAMAEPELRSRLRANTRRVREGLRQLGIETGDFATPIIGFEWGDAERMRTLSADLEADGILVPYAPAYAGVGSEGALRIAVFANHQSGALDRLLSALRRHL